MLFQPACWEGCRFGDRGAQPQTNVAWKGPPLEPKGFLFGDFRLTLAFLRGRGGAWIAALINRPTSGLIRHGNRIAFSFGTWGAYGCAASAGALSAACAMPKVKARKRALAIRVTFVLMGRFLTQV